MGRKTGGHRGTLGSGTRLLTAVIVIVLLAATGAASNFNFGISPGGANEGVHEPGTSFFTSFVLVTDEEDPVDIELSHRDRGINAVRESRQQNFSEQACDDCIEFLRDGGLMEEAGGEDVEQWQNVEFFVNIPDDAEPGYRRIEITPHPHTESEGGGVGLVSSVSFPVTFRVAGTAIRSGQILGMHAGRNVAGEQDIVITYFNDGTVTTRVDSEITVEAVDGNETVSAGSRTVPPGEEARFTATIDTDDLVNATEVDDITKEPFTVHAAVDYTTGVATHTASLTPSKPISVQAAAVRDEVEDPGIPGTVALLLVLLLSTLITWKVVNRVRY